MIEMYMDVFNYYCYLMMFLIIGGTYTVYYYRYYVLCVINNMYDIYLDYKYANYHYHQIVKKYQISNIVIRSDNESRQVPINLPIDLRHKTFKLEFDQLIHLMKINVCNQVHDIVVYIYLIYDDNEYILPVKYICGGMIEFPIYTTNDLDSCMKLEYDYANTAKYDDILGLINKYAGPKGNFFSDTQYQFTPNLILYDGIHPLMYDNNDFLKLTTMMGNSNIYNANQLITIDLNM